MTQRAVEAYLGWLSPQVRPGGADRHQELLWILHQKQFVFIVARDDSRIEDARDLRRECMTEFGAKPYHTPDVLGPHSVLEVLVGLSRRAGSMTSTDPAPWAWQMVINLGLNRYSGSIGPARAKQVDFILERLIYRQYEADGVGGFFPLAQPDEDQTQVELFYQLCAYLRERE